MSAYFNPMLFNSFQFLYFFVVVTAIYFILPHKNRWFLLLASSCYFYMAFVPVYILILGATIVVDYFAGIYIEQSQGKRRKAFLIASLVANIGTLAIFKYYNFINDNLTLLLHGVHINNPIPYLTILLPIGLSFHTFQAMSYTIEVYRGNQPAERNFGIYSLYVMFYPQLVAGPIERPQNLLYQFKTKHEFDYQRIVDGLKLMAWGVFKKVVIADRLAMVVNNVYDHPHEYHGLSLVIATVFFSFQIFCDFSGYTDIALGSAKVMGFTLMKNFNRPYHAKSINDFWSRWHISLSTWFKDYLYIPLGGNRVSVPRWYLNLFIVFLISGLWHGASWTYIIWGGLNGFYLVFALVTRKWRNKMVDASGIRKWPVVYSILQVITTFVLVATAWVFFRAHTLADAVYIIESGYTETGADVVNLLRSVPIHNFLYLRDIAAGGLVILLLEMAHLVQRKTSVIGFLNTRPKYIRWSAYYVFVFLLLLGSVSSDGQFIYFQF
ncbi:MBOAT family O-acyltransferase [Filimonas lacunae]|uniref:MBOAT family O-acyltransferase n=1 Tax=Filimonas lacunae TaxID=477680 RepID=UPI001E3A876E|nr:MBOAT family O-acyltransferase [Filimonas lacunae]